MQHFPDDKPLRICGWMQFKHQDSGERINSPAIAEFCSRPVNWGEKTRMALSLHSPLTDAIGSWEEIRHDCWSKGIVDEAKLWIPMGFTPNDPSTKQLILDQIDHFLRQNANEARKNKAPERRAPACRFDEWLKGWCVDLVWDPLRDLAPSALVLRDLAMDGSIHIDDEEFYQHWLDQPAARAPVKKPFNPSGRAPVAPKPIAQTPAAPTPAAPTPAAPTPAAPTPAAPTPAAPTPVAPTPVAPTPVAPTPVAPTPVAPTPVAVSATAVEGGKLSEEELDKLEASIFGGNDLPDFSSIARSNGHQFRQYHSTAAEDNPSNNPASQPSGKPANSRAEPAQELDLRFARFPRHDDDGHIDWNTALIASTSFLDGDVFNLAKRHWKASRIGASGRKESLYGIGFIEDLARQGVDFLIDGVAPIEKFLQDGPGGKKLDTVNFLLNCFAKSSTPCAKNIAALARAQFFRQKIYDLFDKSPKMPISADDFDPEALQLSPGPRHMGSTLVDADAGTLRWGQNGSDEQVFAVKLQRQEDTERLVKLSSAFATAHMECKAADRAEMGPLAPGSSPIEANAPRSGFKSGARP